MSHGYEQLQEQLRAAVAERQASGKAGRRVRRWWTGGIAISIAAAATAGAVALSPSLRGVEHAPKAPAEGTFSRSLTTGEIGAYGGDPASASRLVVDGRRWAFAKGENGALCAEFPNGSTSCAMPDEIAAGELSVTVAEPPSKEDRKEQARMRRQAAESGDYRALNEAAKGWNDTPATRFGVAVDDVERVRVIGPDDEVVDEAAVEQNTYVVDIGPEGTAKRIEFLGGSGSILQRVEP